MKHFITMILAALAVMTMATSCEKDLPLYSDSDGRIYFYRVYASDTLLNYSFIYHNNVPRDTVYFRVQTMGFLSSQVRHYALEQVVTGDDDAQPGVHYVPFDDPAYESLWVVPADSLQADVPIIIINDASLKTKAVNLKVRLKETADFKLGFEKELTQLVTFTSMLSKPQNWNSLCDWYLGQYGPVKHQFLIDITGYKWDDDFLLNVAKVNDYSYQDYLGYMASKANRALRKLNAERAAQGIGPLAEADGTLVTFGNW